MSEPRGLHGEELKDYVSMQQPYVKLAVGKKINYWTIIGHCSVDGYPNYECQCDCGDIATIEAHKLHRGRAKCCYRCWMSGLYPELYLNEDHTTAEERERYVRCARIKNGYRGIT